MNFALEVIKALASDAYLVATVVFAVAIFTLGVGILVCALGGCGSIKRHFHFTHRFRQT